MRDASARSWRGRRFVGQARLLGGISVFWIGLSALADGLTTLVLPVQVDLAVQSGRVGAVGVVSSVGLVLAVLAQPVAGLASDRLRYRLGRRGWIGLWVVVALCALGALGVAQSLLAIGVAYAVVQVAVSSAQAGQQGFIPDLVAADGRGTAAGVKGLADVAGASLGFVVVGALLARSGVGAALVFVGGMLAITYLVTVVLVREPALEVPERPQGIGLARAFRVQLPRDATFLRLVASRFAFLLGIFAVGRFFLFFVDDRLEMSAAEAGAILGLLAVITFAASPWAGWMADRYGRVPVMRAGGALAATGVAALMPADSTGALVAGGALMALGSAAFSAANWAATVDAIPLPEAGRLMGVANVGTGGAAAAAGLFGPVIDVGNQLKAGAGYVALFLLAIAGFGASALAIRGVRDSEVGGIRPRWHMLKRP